MNYHEAKKAATKKNAGVVYEGDAGDGFTFEVYYCKWRKRRVWTSITPEGLRTSDDEYKAMDFTVDRWLAHHRLLTGKKHGGFRKGAGRKPIDGTQPEMKSVKLCQEHWDKAREIGEGNMAKGLRLALDAWKT